MYGENVNSKARLGGRFPSMSLLNQEGQGSGSFKISKDLSSAQAELMKKKQTKQAIGLLKDVKLKIEGMV